MKAPEDDPGAVLYSADHEATELCEVLGVDPSRCRRLVFDIGIGKAKVYAELYVNKANMGDLIRILRVNGPEVEVVEVPQ